MDTQQTLCCLLSYHLPWIPHLGRNVHPMHDRLIIAPVHSKCDIQQPLAEQHQYDQCEQDVHGVTAGGGVRDDFPFPYIHITIVDRTHPTYISRDSSSLYLTLYLVSSLIFPLSLIIRTSLSLLLTGGKRGWAEEFAISHCKQGLWVEVCEEQDMWPVQCTYRFCKHNQLHKILGEAIEHTRATKVTRVRFLAWRGAPHCSEDHDTALALIPHFVLTRWGFHPEMMTKSPSTQIGTILHEGVASF